MIIPLLPPWPLPLPPPFPPPFPLPPPLPFPPTLEAVGFDRAFLVASVDRLAMINDGFGFDAGEEVIVGVGERLPPNKVQYSIFEIL